MNAENYCMTRLNIENDIKLNTDNFGCHFALPHKDISRLTGYGVNKVHSKEVKYIPYHSNYQKQSHEEDTTNNQDVDNSVVVDVYYLKFTRVK